MTWISRASIAGALAATVLAAGCGGRSAPRDERPAVTVTENPATIQDLQTALRRALAERDEARAQLAASLRRQRELEAQLGAAASHPSAPAHATAVVKGPPKHPVPAHQADEGGPQVFRSISTSPQP